MSDPAIAADYQQVEEICQKIEELKNQNEGVRGRVAAALGGRIILNGV